MTEKTFLTEADQAAAAVAIAPRVSLADIEAFIAAENSFIAGDAIAALAQPVMDAHARLSICLLTLQNGFVIVGKSAPASAANFNADLGRKLARDDAIRQIWPLLGFQLCSENVGITVHSGGVTT